MDNSDRIHNEVSLEWLLDLCDGISSLRNPQDAAIVLRDLLTYKEMVMLAKRIKVAELLRKQQGYRQISGILGVSQDTIARIQRWMEVSGEGYELLLKRISRARETRPTLNDPKYSRLKRFMKRYPLSFWPELAFLELIKIPAKKRDKEIKQLISDLRRKARLYKEIEIESKKGWKTFR